MPAVAAPATQPAQSDALKPAALPALAAPMPTPPIACSAPARIVALRSSAAAHRCGDWRAASRSPSSPSARRRPPAPARVRRPRAIRAGLPSSCRQRFPGHDITVLNRGVNGEETDDMMARFATDVMAAHPQLVLWQVGTNSVLRDRPLDAACGGTARRHRGTQGRRRRRRADRSAIRARGDRQVRDAGHGRSDRARGQGRERRSVPPLRGHARLVRGPAPWLRCVSCRRTGCT